MTSEKKRLIIIDSNSVIHRAFHALPALSRKNGELVNAVYGFLLVFFKALKDLRPNFIAAAFDYPAPTFRSKIYKGYKAKRPPAPEELYRQIPKVKEFLKAMGVSFFEKKGFEADDIIGTIARLAPKKQVLPKIETVILSGDLDTLQLVDDNTKIYALRKGVKDVVLYDEDSVRGKFGGLEPKQILDFKSLRGDPSDNIPGVTGIGEKTAVELLLKFGSLENIYKEIENSSIKAKELKPKLKETLLKYKEQAFISKELAKIEKNVPIDFNLNKCAWRGLDVGKAKDLLEEFEFTSLLKRLSETPVDASEKQEKQIGENLRLW